MIRIIVSCIVTSIVMGCGNISNSPPPITDASNTSTDSLDHTLTMTISGNGSGTITSAPSGISCSPDCSAIYKHGTITTLTAVSDDTSTFAGWLGACTGTDPCIVMMNIDTNVTAVFSRNKYPINIVVNNEDGGDGIVTSYPGNIDCGAKCTDYYTAGTVVTLTAMTSVLFSGWENSCTPTPTNEHICTLTVTKPIDITLYFWEHD